MVSVGIGVPLTYIMLYVLPQGETEEEAEELVYAQLSYVMLSRYCKMPIRIDEDSHLEYPVYANVRMMTRL